MSLKKILILSYCAVALFMVAAFGLFFNKKAGRLFEQYAIEQRTLRIEQIRSQLNHLYNVETGLMDENGLETISYQALQNGFILHVQAESRGMDYNASDHHMEECEKVLLNAGNNIMQAGSPGFAGNYMEQSYPLEHEGEAFGTLIVGYYGPYSLNAQELKLFDALNRTLLFIGAAALAGAIILGTWMARRIVRPMTRVVEVAQKIASGEYGARAQTGRGILETEYLVEAVNEMSLDLEKKEKQKRQITADVAHELRTPLANLQSHMEAMIDGIWEPDTKRLTGCHAEILRLNELVDRLRELHTLENGEWELDRGEFDFYILCQELSRDFALQLRQKNLALGIHARPGDLLYADSLRIRQCMVNLLSNAISYTGEGTEILIGYERLPDGGCRLSVADNGPGVPPKELSLLFERFYRVDKSRNKKKGGMGIGLSITKAIVERHGGTIRAKNRDEGGLLFLIDLPGQKP